MQTLEQMNKYAVDLHWLAFLLTGRRDLSIDIAVETVASYDHASRFFSEWIIAWSRRITIARALAAISDRLAASVRRTEWNRGDGPPLPARDWSLDPGTSKAEIEEALLAIDLFPRAALVLLVFEGVPIADVTLLLHADSAQVRTAQAIGQRELTSNLARMQGWTTSAAEPCFVHSEA